jgi:hypothetical protein
MGAFLADLWRLTTGALGFNPEAYQRVATDPSVRAALVSLAVLAGMSLLVGQSVVLFINRVPPAWFAVVVVVANGLLYALRLVLWGVVTWLIARWFVTPAPSPGGLIRLVALGSAPFVFGWLILIPYLGPIVARLLYVWSFLIVLDGLRHLLPLTFGQALVCVGIGWVISLLVGSLIGRPFGALRDWFFRRRTGSEWLNQPEDVLAEFAEAATAREAAAGGR